MTTTIADIDRHLAECRHRNAEQWEKMSRAKLGTTWDTGDGPLILTGGSYGKRPDLDHLDGDALADALDASAFETVMLTQDGRFVPEPLRWHTDHETVPSPDEWVYYERWSARGREGHGYVHPTTRRLIQSG